METNAVEPWEAVSKKVYWDRDVPLEKWRKRVSEGHGSYLPDAVCLMSAKEFTHYYGIREFVLDWPRLRAGLSADVAKRTGMLGLAWSQLVGGGWNLRPFPDFYLMPAKRRAFLTQVAKTPGKSVCEVAKALGMQFRRARDHASALAKEGKVSPKALVEGGRRKTRLYPAYGNGPG